MKKSVFTFGFLSLFLFSNSQTTIELQPSQMSAIGFHDGFNTANSNFNNAGQFAAYTIEGASGFGVNVNRGLVEFDLSSIPEGAVIESAQLYLFAIPSIGTLNGHTIGNSGAFLQRITEDWSENTVTWNNAPVASVDDQVIIAAAESNVQNYVLDLTNQIDYLYNNQDQNFGFLIKQQSETARRVLIFYSDQASNPANRPYLSVSYSVPVIDPPAPSSCNAVEVIAYAPAKQNDGSILPAARIISANALGAPQNNDSTVGEDDYNFVSLGFGGSITLRMSGPIANGEGNDLKVTETTFGSSSGNCTRYPETVMAFASQDGCNWVYLGKDCQDAEFDLGELDWAEYIKLVDASPADAAYNGSVADGYDVDGVECLNGYRENPEMQYLGSSYAVGVSDFNQGFRKNGTQVAISRSNPELAVGAPQNTNTVNFYSLGFGGSITLKLGYVVFDKAGNDIEIIETSYGNPTCSSYSEKALVEASLDGETYFELGEICLDGMVDFNVQGLSAAQYIRITDRSAMSNFGSTADAFDLDGIIVLQPGCESSNPEAVKIDDISTPNEESIVDLIQESGQNQFKLQFSGSGVDEKYEINIYSITGQHVSSEVIDVPSTINISKSFNLSRFNSGIYVVRAQNATNTHSFKVFKN